MLQLIMTLLDNDSFGLIVNLFIGLTALIVSLVIFVMDKGNSIDKRNILKITLLKESQIQDLIILTIVNYILILIQYFINNSLLILLLIRCFSLTITVWIIIKLFISFIKVIKIMSSDSFKEKSITKVFNNILKNYSSKILKDNHSNSLSFTEFNDKFAEFSCISYSSDFCYSVDNRYKIILSDKAGKIINVNYFNLNNLNKKLEKFIIQNNVKLSDDQKKKVCVIFKKIGDNVEEGSQLLCYDKKFKSFDFENIYKIKETYNLNEQLINRQIVDTFQDYYNNVHDNNMYFIKASSDSLVSLYKTICKNIPNLKQKYYGYLEQLIINDEFKKYDITSSIYSILYNLVFESINMNDIDGYKEFLNYYYWIRTESIDKEKSYFFRQSLLLIKNHIDRSDLDNSAEFYNYTVTIKLKFFKKLLESQLFNEIYNYDHERELKIFEADSILIEINNMNRYPKKYEGLNIEREINELKKEYDNKINELTLNGFVYLIMCEWADYKIKKSQIEHDSGTAFIKNILGEFEHYSLNDLLEFYIIICNDKNLSDPTWRWELDEPENFDRSISSTVDILNKAITLMFQANINDDNKLTDLKYISMKNLYMFQSIKNRVETYDDSNLNCYLKNPVNSKEAILKYLDNILAKCQKDKNKFLSDFKLTEEMNQMFKKSCKNELLNIKENSILFFYNNIGKVLYSKKAVNNFYGYDILEQKEFLSDDVSKNISRLAIHYSESLKDSQEDKIIKKLVNKSKHTEKSIDKIISKFKNVNDLIILSPYYTNEFYPYSYNSNKYYYPYQNKKIPVYIVGSLFNRILIGKIGSFGYLNYYRLNSSEEHNELIDEYTLAYIKDIFKEDAMITKYIKLNPKWLKDIPNKEEYLKMRFRLKLYQQVELLLRENSIIYNKNI